jgi:hypothetical protein
MSFFDRAGEYVQAFTTCQESSAAMSKECRRRFVGYDPAVALATSSFTKSDIEAEHANRSYASV